MNNEPKQKEAGEVGRGLSDVNLLINNVICKDIDVRRPIIRAAHRSYCHKPSSDCALEWKMSSMIWQKHVNSLLQQNSSPIWPKIYIYNSPYLEKQKPFTPKAHCSENTFFPDFFGP